MRNFALQVANEQLYFDTDGKVSDAAQNTLGRWNTEANQIAYTPTDGEVQKIDVDWTFNDKNQLTLSQSNKPVITFVNTSGGLVGFHLENNVLCVDPDGDMDFVFKLNCKYGLDKDGNLLIQIKDKKFTIKGVIDDNQSRFRFRFDDLETQTYPNSLVFSGKWERNGDEKKQAEIHLHFVLQDPSLEITTDPLNLPGKIELNPATNQLEFTFFSKQGLSRIGFQGSLDITPNFQLRFVINAVKEGGLARSSFEVDTTFDFDITSGYLRLRVGKNLDPDQPGQSIQLGGALRMKVNNGTLSLDFTYKKNAAGTQKQQEIAAAIGFESQENGNKLFVKFQQAGKERSVNVTGKLVTARFTIDGDIKVKNDPAGRSIQGFLGFSW